MTNVYYPSDANPDLISNKVVAIVGYGNQGRAQALNMRDSGVKHIIIGSRHDTSWNKANEDGFETFSIAEASEKADIIFMLLPDEVAPQVYHESIEPYLKPGDVLNFSSGYNIIYKHIVPPAFVDVVMVGPRMIGEGVREMFTRGEGFATFLSVAQDSTGNAKEIAKALAMAMGSKKGAIEVSFEDETYLDLMSEQGTWPLIMKVMYEVYRFLVDQGHPEEAVLMELYLSKEAMFMMEKMADDGVFKQLPYHSNTSQYGQLSGFDKVDSTYIRKFVEDTYNRIKGDAFDQEWQDIQKNGNVRLAELKDAAYKSDLTLSEERVKARLS